MTETQDKINLAEKRRKPAQNGPKNPSPLEAKRAQNLRDNLLKRKLQARARAEAPAKD